MERVTSLTYKQKWSTGMDGTLGFDPEKMDRVRILSKYRFQGSPIECSWSPYSNFHGILPIF